MLSSPARCRCVLGRLQSLDETPPLRILHVASGDLWAGAEVQVFTLMSHLARMPETAVAAVLLNEGALAAKLRAVGIEVFIADERQSGAVGLLMRLHGVLRGWRPDLVHTHRVKENILGAIANRLGGNVPCVRTVHGSHERRPVRGARGAINRAVFGLDRWCGRVLQQKIIAVSEPLAVELAQEYPPGRIAILENGVDVDRVLFERAAAGFRAATPDAQHIGIVGRLVSVKRVDLFLQAASLLRTESIGSALRFHVFGDGPLRPDLENLARQLHLADVVRFHGHRHDIASCIGQLDLLVICSDHEGLPMVALEALVLRVPTVAHAVGGLVDVVPEEFLVRRHDPQAYKSQILHALGKQGRMIAEANSLEKLPRFTAERNAQRAREVYAELIATREGTRR